MKPLRAVPATLVSDLKRFAYYTNDGRLALDLLCLDAATPAVERRAPGSLAHTLTLVAKRIARSAVPNRKAARDHAGYFVVEDGGPRAPHAEDLHATAEHAEHAAQLQARVWRVVQRLALTERGGPIEPRGCTWFRPAPGCAR